METKIYNVKGEATSSKATLSDDVFGITPNDHAIYLDVRLHLANRRQGIDILVRKLLFLQDT